MGVLALPARVWSSGIRLGWRLTQLTLPNPAALRADFMRSGSGERFGLVVQALDDSSPSFARLAAVQVTYSGTLEPLQRGQHDWKRWILQVLSMAVDARVSAARGASFAEALGRKTEPRRRPLSAEGVLDLLSPHWTLGDEVAAGCRLAG